MRPLRVAAIAILVASVAAGVWLWLGGPGQSSDPVHAAAHARSLSPFAGASAAVALLVFVASGTARSRRRWAARGLWLAMIGAFGIAVSLVGELGFPANYSRGYALYEDPYLNWILVLVLVSGISALSLIAGGLLWLLSYWLDRRRSAR